MPLQLLLIHAQRAQRRGAIVSHGGLSLGLGRGCVVTPIALDRCHRLEICERNVTSSNTDSTGAMARPNVRVGHILLDGIGTNNRYEIDGTFFYQNPTTALLQSEGNIALIYNLFVTTAASATNIQAHHDKPRTGDAWHNTVVAAGSGIRVSGGDTRFVQRIIGNAVFAITPIAGRNALGNIVDSFAFASSYLNAPTAAPGQLDLSSKMGHLSGPEIDLTTFSGNVDGAPDFIGKARTKIISGACDTEGADAGWKPGLTIKPTIGDPSCPMIELTADPTIVSLQGSGTLIWTVIGADSCAASGGWSGSRLLVTCSSSS